MKLKTKFQDEDFKRGEIVEADISTMPDGRLKIQSKAMRGGLHTFFYESKGEFDDDWEDVPPRYYYITEYAQIEYDEIFEEDKEEIDYQKSIGNYFETKEEAEKAMEKLKAWKRLKDKGFRFEGIKEDYTRILQNQDPFRTGKRYLQFNKSEDEEWMKENWEDLDLLFGGEK